VAFPLEGEAFALDGLDRLDATGVIILDKDAATVRAFPKREAT